MTRKSSSLGLHTIGDDGTLTLADEVFEVTDLEPGGNCFVIGAEGGGITVMPVTEDFDPKPSGQ